MPLLFDAYVEFLDGDDHFKALKSCGAPPPTPTHIGCAPDDRVGR